jgi:hypothetical protein
VNEPSSPAPAAVDAPAVVAVVPGPPTTAAVSPPPLAPHDAASKPAAAPAPPSTLLIHSAANQTYCIDAAQDSSGKRTPVRLYTCHGQENQRWTLAPGPNGSTTVAGIGGQCLDVHGAHPPNGANAQLHPCDGSGNQQFTFDAGHLRDVTTGRCLTVTRAARGAPIIIEPCDPGNAGQAWSTTDR